MLKGTPPGPNPEKKEPKDDGMMRLVGVYQIRIRYANNRIAEMIIKTVDKLNHLQPTETIEDVTELLQVLLDKDTDQNDHP